MDFGDGLETYGAFAQHVIPKDCFFLLEKISDFLYTTIYDVNLSVKLVMRSLLLQLREDANKRQSSIFKASKAGGAVANISQAFPRLRETYG